MENEIIQGDCIKIMKTMPENSVDAIVCDPPYGLEFMGKKWDKLWDKRTKADQVASGRPKRGGYTKLCESAPSKYIVGIEGQKWHQQWATLALKVLKPGGFLLAFGGTRTYHRLACAIEDAGFEIRDCILWLYGSGFPKSLDISKAIDKKRNIDIEPVRLFLREKLLSINKNEIAKICDVTIRQIDHWIKEDETQPQIPSLEKWNILKKYFDIQNRPDVRWINLGKVVGKVEEPITWFGGDKLKRIPSTPEAQYWNGWGTALKPACEPIVVARKPLSEKSVALNVLKWGTGGINIDGGRISLNGETPPKGSAKRVFKSNKFTDKKIYGDNTTTSPKGRFPANVIFDPESAEVLDQQAPETGAFAPVKSGQKAWGGNIYGKFNYGGDDGASFHNDGLQGASRFFYVAKASRAERNMGLEGMEPQKRDPSRKDGNPGGDNPRNRGVHKVSNFHPTVKPIQLMRYLVRLVTPKNGIVLDPFIGSGTTGIACLKEGFKFIGIEKEAEYVKIARGRINHVPKRLDKFTETVLQR